MFAYVTDSVAASILCPASVSCPVATPFNWLLTFRETRMPTPADASVQPPTSATTVPDSVAGQPVPITNVSVIAPDAQQPIHETAGLKRAAFGSAAWTLVGFVVMQVLRFASNIILA